MAGERGKQQARVLMVTGIYPTERQPHAGTFIRSQVESLRERGLEVEVIHPHPGPAALRYVMVLWQVVRKTRGRQFDIVHGQYGLWCLVARLQWWTPVVASFLGDDVLGTVKEDGSLSKKSLLVVCVSRWLCRRVDAVIVKSRGMAEAMLAGQRARCVAEKLSIIPNGVDFALFQPVSRALARAALGWEQEGRYVLFGNDPSIPVKNYALAQAAVTCARRTDCALELMVACGLPQEQMPLYLNASNALLLTSLSEGSPNIVKEAMACNIPVVATAVGDVAEVIGKTEGCAVCPTDAEALALGLARALRCERTSGREDIRHLDRRVIAERVLAVYDVAMRAHVG